MPPRKKAAPKDQCKLVCCTCPEAATDKIREDLQVWKAGSWAELVNPGPTCTCTLANAREVCILHGGQGSTDDLPSG